MGVIPALALLFAISIYGNRHRIQQHHVVIVVVIVVDDIAAVIVFVVVWYRGKHHEWSLTYEQFMQMEHC